MIYVMGAAGSSVVKIGTAASPAARLRAIQAGHPYPLAVLFEAEGGRDLERLLHQAFAALRVSEREWFDFGDLDPIEQVSTAIQRRTVLELETSDAPDWGTWAALSPSGVPS